MTANANLCPYHTQQTIQDYITKRWEPGSFVRAVLENNLREACASADNINIRALPHIVAYCYNYIPSNAWGSPERVDAWLNRWNEDDEN